MTTALTLQNLEDLFRREIDDMATPSLYSQAEVYDYANDAQNEACRRARLIVDSTTAAICSYTVGAGASLITLDQRVIFIRRARLSSRTVPLVRMFLADMEEQIPNWETSLAGIPDRYIPDYQVGSIKLYRPSLASDTLNLTVVRLPLTDMAATTDTPEIHPSYHRNLRFWMLYRAFSKHDAERYDMKKADANLKLFEAEFGYRSSAYDEAWLREHQIDAYDGQA
jgi:hypothetical protein